MFPHSTFFKEPIGSLVLHKHLSLFKNDVTHISQLSLKPIFNSQTCAMELFLRKKVNYCSLVRHFSTKTSSNKIEKIQERCLKLLYNNTTGTYDDLLVKTLQSFMEISV